MICAAFCIACFMFGGVVGFTFAAILTMASD
jgi:hypothetical protein